MSSAQGVFVPYLTDNVFRLSGIGSCSSLSELRQAVRRAESGTKVGLKPSIPASFLLGESEVENLSVLLQCVSSDPVQRTAHRILWFLHWSHRQSESSSEQSATGQATSTPTSRSNLPTAVNSLLENVQTPDKVSRVQRDFLLSLFSFLLNNKPYHLEKTLQQYYQFCIESSEYLVSFISTENRCSEERAQLLLQEAQRYVAESILNSAVDLALELFSKNKFDEATRIISLIADSPLEDEWEDCALRRISQYTETLVEEIETAARNLNECDMDYVNPYEKECNILLDLARRLKGRVTQAFRWETAVHDWRDQIAIAKANRIVANLNARLESLDRKTNYSELENLGLLQSLVSHLHEAKESLKSISRHQLTSRAISILNQRLRELDEFLQDVDNQVRRVMQAFILQIAEMKSLVLMLATGNYVLRHSAKIEIQYRAERMLQFLDCVSRMQISEQSKTVAEHLRRDLEMTCSQLGIHPRSQTLTHSQHTEASASSASCIIILAALIALIVALWYLLR